jgi:hypothetical protein
VILRIEDNPAMQREYAHLRRMVENWTTECNRRDPVSNATQNLYQAREDLRKFKQQARKLGYNI